MERDFNFVDTDVTPTYIYALLDPDIHEVRYVGKSDTPVVRFKTHVGEVRRLIARKNTLIAEGRLSDNGYTPKETWIKELLDADKQPKLAILEETGSTPQEWGPAEQKWIYRLSQEGHRLLNAQCTTRRRSNTDLFYEALELGQDLFDTSA